jgi:hypothetical protein
MDFVVYLARNSRGMNHDSTIDDLQTIKLMLTVDSQRTPINNNILPVIVGIVGINERVAGKRYCLNHGWTNNHPTNNNQTEYYPSHFKSPQIPKPFKTKA